MGKGEALLSRQGTKSLLSLPSALQWGWGTQLRAGAGMPRGAGARGAKCGGFSS